MIGGQALPAADAAGHAGRVLAARRPRGSARLAAADAGAPAHGPLRRSPTGRSSAWPVPRSRLRTGPRGPRTPSPPRGTRRWRRPSRARWRRTPDSRRAGFALVRDQVYFRGQPGVHGAASGRVCTGQSAKPPCWRASPVTCRVSCEGRSASRRRGKGSSATSPPGALSRRHRSRDLRAPAQSLRPPAAQRRLRGGRPSGARCPRGDRGRAPNTRQRGGANTELGDTARVEVRECGLHPRTARPEDPPVRDRSFEKLTGEGRRSRAATCSASWRKRCRRGSAEPASTTSSSRKRAPTAPRGWCSGSAHPSGRSTTRRCGPRCWMSWAGRASSNTTTPKSGARSGPCGSAAEPPGYEGRQDPAVSHRDADQPLAWRLPDRPARGGRRRSNHSPVVLRSEALAVIVPVIACPIGPLIKLLGPARSADPPPRRGQRSQAADGADETAAPRLRGQRDVGQPLAEGRGPLPGLCVGVGEGGAQVA